MTDDDGTFGDSIKGWARRQAQAYRRGHDRPLGGYLGVIGVYLGSVGVTAGVARLTGRRPSEPLSPFGLAQMIVATHRIARTIAKDPVTSPIRAPFTEFEGTSAPAELAERVRAHSGAQHSVGELISCPMCLAQWVASALSAGLVFAPRSTRMVMETFTAIAGADFLQYAYALLQDAAE